MLQLTISKSLVARVITVSTPTVKAYAKCMRQLKTITSNDIVIPSDESLDNVVNMIPYQLISNDSNIKAKLNISQTEDTVTLSVNSEYVIESLQAANEYLVAVCKAGEGVIELFGKTKEYCEKTKEVSKKFK